MQTMLRIADAVFVAGKYLLLAAVVGFLLLAIYQGFTGDHQVRWIYGG